ncbi:MAG: type II and III secretion system protein family protein [Methylovirgula sp.]
MKRRAPTLLCGFSAALMVLAPMQDAFAQASMQVEDGSNGGFTRRISMGVGKSLIVDLPRDAAEIFVGNPKVANAIVRSARKLYVIGLDKGQTTVFALDAEGHQIAALQINIGRDVGELQQILRAAMPTSNIIARTVNDTIILSGEVDSAEEAKRANDIAEGFAKDFNGANGSSTGMVVNSLTIHGRDQVMLKVTIAEIDRSIAKQLGLTSSTWGPFTQYNPFGINGNIATSASGQTSGITLSNPSGTVSATLQAFERYGVSHILAEPTVSAVSGETANFTVGGEFPIPGPPTTCPGATTTVCSGGAVYQPYGVMLNFTPVVLGEGRILLHLSTEVTDIDYTKTVDIQGVPTPGLLTRKNATSIELPSGGSIASAGLLQTVSRQVINGFPGLMDLPILGTLFRSRDYQRQETELMIIVTPYLVQATTAAALPQPDDGFADSSDPQAWLLGRMNRLYASPNNPEAVKNFKGRIGFIVD